VANWYLKGSGAVLSDEGGETLGSSQGVSRWLLKHPKLQL